MTPPTRLGDGTDVSFKGISEVRKGNGTVLWSAIPDSVIDQTVAHYSAQAAFDDGDDGSTITTWPDEREAFDATGGSPTVRSDGINGHIAVEFDGTDDALEPSSSDWNTLTQPNTVFVVLSSTGFEEENRPFARSSDTSDGHIIGQSSSDWRIWAGDDFLEGTTGNSPTVLTAVFDGSSSSIREDATETATGDVGTNDLDHFAIGEDSGISHFSGMVGEIRIVDGTIPSDDLQEYESYLLDKWDF